MDKNRNLSNFEILRLVRDARSSSYSERLVLNAIALRASPAKGYSCFPSYKLLSLDTQLDPKTVQRAVKSLEDGRLVKRVGRGRHSNLFFLNVNLLIEQAAANLETKRKEDDPMLESPFGEVSLSNLPHEEDFVDYLTEDSK